MESTPFVTQQLFSVTRQQKTWSDIDNPEQKESETQSPRGIQNIADIRYRQTNRSIVQNPSKSSGVRPGRLSGLAETSSREYSLATRHMAADK